MADTVKRLNYFDHQFLRAQDFTDEQKYHLSMRRMHNRLLHTWGVASGLKVTVATGGTGTAVTVGAGVAIDSQGNELVLPSDTNVELGGLAAGTPIFLTLSYNEQESDPTTEAGGQGNTRFTEQPKLTPTVTAPTDPSMVLILGKVTRTASTLGSIDESDRRVAGNVTSPDLTVNSVTLKRDGVAQAAWPKLSCSGANQAALTNGNLNIDAQREIFFADGGQIRSLDQNHKIVFNRANNLLDLYEFGDIRFLTGSPGTEKMRVQQSGNVGIGTASPNRNLSIAGTGGVYANIKNANAEVLVGVDTASILSSMTSTDLHIRTNNANRIVIAGNDGNTRIAATLSVGSFGLPTFEGRICVTGPGAELGFARRNLTAWPATPAAGDRFLWYNPDGTARFWTEAAGDLLTVDKAGRVGLGLGSTELRLDSLGRIRIRQDAAPQDHSAGIWLWQSGTKTDRAFVGMLDDNHVGFWSNAGQGWAYHMDVTNGTSTFFGKVTIESTGNGCKINCTGGANGRMHLSGDELCYILHKDGLIIGKEWGGNGNLTVEGNAVKPGGGFWGATSDKRLKKNISQLSGALDKLLSLRGVNFEWKDPAKYGDLTGQQMGLIAQEVEEVFPEWIGTDHEGFKTITIRGLEALAIEALRELKGEIASVKKSVAEIQSKLGVSEKAEKPAEKKTASKTKPRE
jgi:endosialidase-like protein